VRCYNSATMEILESGAKKLGLELTPKQLGRFQTYYEEMADWNKRVNLTRITGYKEVQVKHFLESLTVAQAIKPTPGLRLIDIGAGAGVPGLPLKIAFPEIRLTLLDSTAKKADFLRHITTRLGLDGVGVVVGRAEYIGHQAPYREGFDLVLARGVAPLATLVELTLPFCTVGGSFVSQKKGEIDAEISQAQGAIALLGGKLREVMMVDLAEFADERRLVIVDKVSPTPPKYPRRPGVPRKRPILDKQGRQE